MIDKKIIEYYCFRRATVLDLSNIVNQYIQNGWQPFGAPFSDCAAQNEDQDVSICQAMVKYE